MYFYARFRDGGNRFIYQLLVSFEKLSCRLADRIIATNESYKNIEVERGGVSEDRVTIVRNGPDLDMLSPKAPDLALREKATTILGYVGAMGPQDGVDYLLRAIRHLVFDLDVKDVYCIIIGRGKALPSLQGTKKELSLEPYIRFTGWIPDEDKLRYLATTDICLDPDPSNPFNDRCTMIKMMEYMALGKPIVAFDLPEHRVSADSAALYARPNDELDFAKKIAALINDPSQRQRMGEVGRERIKSGLAWPFQAEKLVHAYGDLFEKM
jgi:glycosyltransferase involved in cell wall biosynthesis